MYYVIETAPDGRQICRAPCPTREAAERYIEEYGRLVSQLFDVTPTPDGGLTIVSPVLGDIYHVTIQEQP